MNGVVNGQEREFSVGIGQGAQDKHAFRVGDVISSDCLPVADPQREPVDFYKAARLKVIERGVAESGKAPPWAGVPPSLEGYRARGHRRLAARTYEGKCGSCIWGCRMSVERIIDQWNPANKRYRFETFCYGPKSCKFYKAGPTRKVPGRKGMMWEEADWIDEMDTAHREPDE
ncbi:MAG: hypothetical protein IBX71_08965 [Candidatus Desulforudis sp.]|nr:hypothetical protein [Desulforudis sp.]